MKKMSMVMQIMLAVVLGIIFALLFPQIAKNLKVIGSLFLRLMQMTIPILVLGQVIQAVSSVEQKELTSLGGKTIIVFGVSSFLAACWGIFMGIIAHPGAGINISNQNLQGISVKAQQVSLSDTLLNFVPQNIFDALSKGSIIQIIVFALFFGVALNKYRTSHPETKIYDLIVDFNEIILTIIRYIMYVAPIGIFALISSTISSLGIKIILPLLKYLIVYAIATILFFVIWIIIICLYVRVSPIKLIKNTKNMSVMALATTSSAITLPVEMDEAINKVGISKRVSNLVLPLGMSLNSNGSAMHMAITVITIAQLYHIDYDFQKIIYLAIVATLVSLANAVVPGAAFVSLAIIVPQMGLPIESIAIFAGVEWFVGMLRTILNVNSDVYSAIIVAKSVNELDYNIFNSSN